MSSKKLRKSRTEFCTRPTNSLNLNFAPLPKNCLSWLGQSCPLGDLTPHLTLKCNRCSDTGGLHTRQVGGPSAYQWQGALLNLTAGFSNQQFPTGVETARLGNRSQRDRNNEWLITFLLSTQSIAVAYPASKNVKQCNLRGTKEPKIWQCIQAWNFYWLCHYLMAL